MPSGEAPRNFGPGVFALACGAVLLLGCVDAARYVVVGDARVVGEQDTAERRLVCLSDPDAAANPGLLGLRTSSAVREYGKRRRGDAGAVEAVLFQLVSGDYARATETLRARGGEIPEYLRRLIAADLAAEWPREGVGTADLVRLYQEAYDVQESAKARAVIALRIRQRRYGR